MVELHVFEELLVDIVRDEAKRMFPTRWTPKWVHGARSSPSQPTSYVVFVVDWHAQTRIATAIDLMELDDWQNSRELRELVRNRLEVVKDDWEVASPLDIVHVKVKETA